MDIDSLEERIDSLLEEEGLANLGWISSRKVSAEIYHRGYGDLDELYNYLDNPTLEKSRGYILWYMRNFQKNVESNNYPLDAVLGLLLISSDVYKEVNFREKIFCDRLENEISIKKTEIADLGSQIRNLENSLSGKFYNLLHRIGNYYKPLDYVSNFVANLFLSGFDKKHEEIVKQKIYAERTYNKRKGVLYNTLKNYFHPIRVESAFVFGGIVRRIFPTEFGSKDINLTRILRKRSVELMEEVIDICSDPDSIHYLESDTYRYALVLHDKDPEKLSLLENCLKYIKEHNLNSSAKKDELKLNSRLMDLFMIRYVQEKRLSFELLDESYGLSRETIMKFRDDAFHGQNVQLLMHIFNTQFVKLNNFLHNVATPDDFEMINGYCIEHDFSFSRLYNQFSSIAVKSVPVKHRTQYRKILDFKGI